MLYLLVKYSEIRQERECNITLSKIAKVLGGRTTPAGLRSTLTWISACDLAFAFLQPEMTSAKNLFFSYFSSSSAILDPPRYIIICVCAL